MVLILCGIYVCVRALDCGVKVIGAHCATEVRTICGYSGTTQWYNTVVQHSGTTQWYNTGYVHVRVGICVYLLWQGSAADLDNGGVSVSCFSLFMRLMREDK